MASSVAARSSRTTAARRATSSSVVPNAPVEPPCPPAPAFSVTDVVGRFQRMLQAQERSPCTVKQYGHIARTFLGHVKKPLESVEPRDLEAFREYLVLERRYSKNSLYTTVRGLACLFKNFGIEMTEGLEPPRRPERLPRYLSEEEVHRLFEVTRQSLRDAAIVRVLGYTGLRVGELCNLKVEDIDFARNVLHVRSGKGDRDREIVLEDSTRDAIERYLTDRTIEGKSHPRLFPVSPVTVERMIRTAAKAAGIGQRVTPHVLRHTLATALLRRGCDIRYIQQLLGHASVSTTQIYTHVDTQSLRDAYQRAKPQY
jgi:integrase/recombinase XerD